MFDRLLFLSEGRSAYFGELGAGSQVLIEYFERNGARKCGPNENPAEWLVEITQTSRTWPDIWSQSEERKAVKADIEQMKSDLLKTQSWQKPAGDDESEFAAPFLHQLYTVTKRNLVSDWRSPAYMYSKVALVLGFVSTYSTSECFRC